MVGAIVVCGLAACAVELHRAVLAHRKRARERAFRSSVVCVTGDDTVAMLPERTSQDNNKDLEAGMASPVPATTTTPTATRRSRRNIVQAAARRAAVRAART